MKSTVIWGLIVINGLLAFALLSRVAAPNTALAQNRPAEPRPEANRPARPGDYVMIPGEVTGGSTSVVYVIDTTNGLLGAIAYDDSVKQLQSMPGRIDLQQVFTQATPRQGADGKKQR
ncbi:MAG TPA: hypothetical protein PLD59_02980 [Tepidisphaeraceae bacterium]|nr:hypothetical protein [Tepidisphaeraceae bacterium]